MSKTENMLYFALGCLNEDNKRISFWCHDNSNLTTIQNRLISLLKELNIKIIKKDFSYIELDNGSKIDFYSFEQRSSRLGRRYDLAFLDIFNMDEEEKFWLNHSLYHAIKPNKKIIEIDME